METLFTLSALAVAALAIKIVRTTRLDDWKTVLSDEDGAAYSISYVLVFPVYILVVGLLIETGLIMMVKMGTLYAAYSAARSGIVWSSLLQNNPALAQEKARRAAVNAMVPYASSLSGHARAVGINGLSSPRGDEYYNKYRAFTQGNSSRQDYIVAKYRWADFATEVKLERVPLGGSAEPWNADIRATVNYKMPMHLTAIARFLGQQISGPSGPYYIYPITSKARLQDEAPQNQDMRLGVNYVPD